MGFKSHWEYIEALSRSINGSLHRVKVPGGWLVRYDAHGCDNGSGITFLPDPQWKWDISTLEIYGD